MKTLSATLAQAMKTALGMAAGGVLAMPGGAVQAATVSATTDLEIMLPGVLILHYPSTVVVDLTGADLAAFSGAVPNPVDEGTRNASGALSGTAFTADVAIAPLTSGGSNSTGTLTLQNAWAVRALSNKGQNVTLSIALPDGTLEYDDAGAPDGTSTIGLSAQQVSYDGTSFANNVSFPSPGLGAAAPEVGDVRFTMSLANTKYSGTYKGGQYTITATAP